MPFGVAPAVAAPPEPGAVAAGSAGTVTGPVEAQRSGQGVIVNGQKQSGGNLDLGQLDKALAKSGTSGGTGTGTGSGSSTGSGSGSGSGTGRGTGGGSQTGTVSGTGTGAGSIEWAEAGVGKARTLVSAPKPKVPDWVGEQGLTLRVTVTFAVGADGLVSDVKVSKSSGYVDVDAAVLAAIRRWRFSTVASADLLHGTVPYVIKAE